ncbi:MAG: AI-2E family transporter [Proteobacteria bacterium]|nr:AI-2E family transporter [Pseudomonadota bacterium]
MSTAPVPRALIVLLAMACFVVVVAGLRVAGQIILPTMVALFLSLLSLPPMRRLERLGVPSGLAIAIVVIAASTMVFLVSAVFGRSITQFQSQIPFYQERLDLLVGSAVGWLAAKGIELDPDKLVGSIDGSAILRLVSNTASGLVAALSNLFLVILTMVFMLLEANSLAAKLRTAMGDPNADLSQFTRAAKRVNKYLAIKTWVSLATGVLVGLLCMVVGVNFPLLWALIAFLFNFVPNIGSIIAAVPAILLTLVQYGVGRAAIVGAGYLIINVLIGNAVEPRLMGRRLGLSTLVVFLSMLFWGWVWGPVGMLLSVPLTVIIKILFEYTDDLRWLAILLGPGDSASWADSDSDSGSIGG